MSSFLCFFRYQQKEQRARIVKTTKPRLKPSDSANLLDLRPTPSQVNQNGLSNERIIQEKDNSKTKILPDEELKETERGLGLIDPEQISGGLFLQIKGFPATLHSTTESRSKT